MKKKYNISCGTVCDIGDKKPTNQDCIFNRTALISGNNVGLFIVADGVGGLVNGDVISNIIALHFQRWFDELENGKILVSDCVKTLDNAINIVNNMAYEYSESIGEKMGSTIVLLLIINNRYFIRNVGDSRAYHINKGQLIQLSMDHSYVAEMVRKGIIGEAEAKYHPKRNVLLSCIGVNPQVQWYETEGTFEKDIEFLLCSDGYYNYVDSIKAREVLIAKKLTEQEKTEKLRECIPTGNAKDNVSIVLIKVKVKKTLF